jgi:hypothetical protein
MIETLILSCWLQQQPIAVQEPISLKAKSQSVTIDREGRLMIEAIGSVLFTYQDRTLRTEYIQLDTERGLVRGDRHLTLYSPASEEMPEIRLTGEGFEYYYRRGEQSGWFNKAYLEAGEFRLWADRLEGSLEAFSSHNVQFTTCDKENPDYLFTADRVRLTASRRLSAKNVRLKIRGRTLLSLPSFSTHLKGAPEEFDLPEPTYSARTGFGLRYNYSVPMSERGEARLSGAWFLKEYPETRFRVAWNFAEETPPSADAERNAGFENDPPQNLRAGSMQNELLRIREPLNMLILQRMANVRARRKQMDLLVSKPWEVGYGVRLSGIGNGTGILFARVGSLEERQSGQVVPARTRLNVQGEWLQTPNVQEKSLYWRLHLWGAGYAYGKKDLFGWLKPQLELLWERKGQWNLTLGYAQGVRFGKTPYLFDDLIARREATLRAEGTRGNYRLGLLLKYDMDENELYDVQVLLGIRQHCVEPTLFWRKSPGTLQLGLLLTAFR